MSSGVPDAPAWWAEPGRPGFEPDQASGVVYPWVLAGHVRGAWAIEDPDLPELGPIPGIMGVQTPLGWADSLEVESGADQGWDGYHAALAKVRVRRSLPGRVRARTRSIGDMTLGSGSDALDGNGLGVAVGDSANWWRMGTLSWTRGGLGDLGPAGRHHYSFGSVWTRGSHALSGRIAQAGSAAELVSGESQSVTGAGGSLRYQYALDHSALGLEAARGYDHHESFGGLLSGSRRDAHQRRATAEWIGDEERWGLRIDARDEWVTRVTPGVGEIPWKARSLWAAGRIEGRRGPASVEASAGGGRNGALRGNAFAPSLRLRFGDGAWTTSVHAGRVLAPVWSDLAPGEAPFLQSTWNGGADVAVRGGPGRRLEIEWLTGRTVGRALLLRFPFEELWLRDGYREDPSAFQFGLATARGDWRVGSWTAHGELYGLLRDSQAPQVALDPQRGGNASLETSFRAFAGDLGVRIRGEVAGISGHSLGPTDPWRPGYLTYGLTAALTLSDATVTMRVRNLENQLRPLPWTVPSTGEDALSAGTELRLGMTWRLYN